MHVALLGLAALTLLVGLLLPLVRLWLREGVVGLVRPTDPIQRFVHQAFTLTLLGYGGWTAALAALGPKFLDVWSTPPWLALLGVGVAAAGLLLVVMAQAQMGRSWRIGIATEPTGLVTHGVFRFSRNPIYFGMLLLVIGVALAAPSGWTVVGLALVYLEIGFQARAEEAHLIETHGEVYLLWASQVGCFVPWIGRLGGAR